MTRLRTIFNRLLHVVLCISLYLVALDALAATSSKTLKNNQWELLSFPIGNSDAIFSTLIADSLPADQYESSWVIYSYATGSYQSPALTESPEPGVGYWVIQITGADIQLNVDTQDALLNLATPAQCISSIGCVEATPRTLNNASAWSILGTSLPTISILNDVQVIRGSVGDPCSPGCSIDEALSNDLAHEGFYKYNGDLRRYELLETMEYVTAWQAFWYRTKPHPDTQQVYFPAISSGIVCTPRMIVSSESDINNAIDCANTSLFDIEIVFTSDVVSTTPFNTIDRQQDTSLTIAGNRFRISAIDTTDVQFSIQNGEVHIESLWIDGALNGTAVSIDNDSMLSLSNVEISNSGLGLSSESSLASTTIDSSLFNYNTTALQVTSGEVTVANSTLGNSRRNGVTVNSGALTIVNSSITGGQRSAVYIDGGQLSIKNSSVSNNRLAAINSVNGTTLISNSTLSGNRNGFATNGGDISLGNSTLAFSTANGMRIYGANISIFSSIVGNNGQPAVYGNCVQFSGSIQFTGPSRSSYTTDRTCAQFSTGSALSGILLPPSNADTLDLGPLQDNGCTTLSRTSTGLGCVSTHQLATESVANGSGACRGSNATTPTIPTVTLDQREFARNNACDSGSFENL